MSFLNFVNQVVWNEKGWPGYAWRIGAAGSSPDFSKAFHNIWLGICLEILFSGACLDGARGARHTLVPKTKNKKKLSSVVVWRAFLQRAPDTAPRGGFDLSQRARSAGSRTALAPLQFRIMRCQNEWKKLARIRYLSHLLRYQAWIWWFTFLHDQWDRSRLQKKMRNHAQAMQRRVDPHASTTYWWTKLCRLGAWKPMVRNGSLWIEKNPDESLSYSSFPDKRRSSFPARSAQLVELNAHKEPLVFRNLKFHANAIIRRTALAYMFLLSANNFVHWHLIALKKPLSKVRQNFRSQWFLLQKGSNLPFQAFKSSKFSGGACPRTP